MDDATGREPDSGEVARAAAPARRERRARRFAGEFEDEVAWVLTPSKQVEDLLVKLGLAAGG